MTGLKRRHTCASLKIISTGLEDCRLIPQKAGETSLLAETESFNKLKDDNTMKQKGALIGWRNRWPDKPDTEMHRGQLLKWRQLWVISKGNQERLTEENNKSENRRKNNLRAKSSQSGLSFPCRNVKFYLLSEKHCFCIQTLSKYLCNMFHFVVHLWVCLLDLKNMKTLFLQVSAAAAWMH